MDADRCFRFLAARRLVILGHRHPFVGRVRRDSVLVADLRQPAQRTLDWVSLRLLQRLDNGLAICGLPSGGRAPERALPAIGVVQVLKDRQFPAHIEPRTPVLRTQRETTWTLPRLGKTRELQLGASSKTGSPVTSITPPHLDTLVRSHSM